MFLAVQQMKHMWGYDGGGGGGDDDKRTINKKLVIVTANTFFWFFSYLANECTPITFGSSHRLRSRRRRHRLEQGRRRAPGKLARERAPAPERVGRCARAVKAQKMVYI